jgi:hypothetical protein
MTDYLENKLIDFLFRGQSLTAPTTIYISLHTSTPTDSSTGTEVSGNGYARASLAASLVNWAGTQSAGSTTASSGTSGTTSNNAVITFSTPTGNWGTITHFGVWDALTSGNRLFWGALSSSKTIFASDSVSIQTGQLQIQIDN